VQVSRIIFVIQFHFTGVEVDSNYVSSHCQRCV